MSIIRAIIDGERAPKALARHRRCENSEEVIEKSLCGYYKAESLFTLKHTLATYDHYQLQIKECD
jgi:hypothetical protein